MNQHVSPGALDPAAVSEDEEIAALEFEPWVHEENEWTPPTNHEWCEAVDPTLIAIRMAWLSLYKTKTELGTMLANMGKQTSEDGENLAIVFIESILAAQDRIGAINAVLECATARLMVAGLGK